MCKAFSCIVGSDKKVAWKLGVDSHTDLLKLTSYKDNTADPRQMEFARVEITPENGDYLNPDKWTLEVDERIRPAWWSRDYETAAYIAHAQWLQELDKVLIRKPIVHPFKLTPPEITQEHVDLVKTWASVRASVRASVGASVGDSVRDSVWDSVWDSEWDSVGASVRDSVMASVGDSVWDSVRASVGASVRDSVGAYIGSFFRIAELEKFSPAVKLWKTGLVPSYDGKVWRLHGGPDGKVLWTERP